MSYVQPAQSNERNANVDLNSPSPIQTQLYRVHNGNSQFSKSCNGWQKVQLCGKLVYTQARNQGGEFPQEKFSPPWKNILDIV